MISPLQWLSLSPMDRLCPNPNIAHVNALTLMHESFLGTVLMRSELAL